jgi:AbrB family looped-hinge helix DNA binding protein
MTVRIDKAGRVILPKPLRDRLGLHAGSDLEMEETQDGVVLKLVGRKPSLIGKGSFLVHTGEIPRGYDILKAIDEDRDKRMRKGEREHPNLPEGPHSISRNLFVRRQ